MDWIQVSAICLTLFSIAATNVGLILWFRSESRSDWRHMDSKVDAIHEEIKDFHGRLCVIEERRLQYEMGKR